MSVAFVPGLELARLLHRDVVGPLLRDALGDRPYAVALLGPGSEVLGFDTERSRDHDWGPRLQVFLRPCDALRAPTIEALLAARLPTAVAGHPTSITWDDGHVGHGVEVIELGAWLRGQLGVDPRAGFAVADWLASPTQALGELTAGAVFHDPDGELAAVRATLAWYPPDVWRHVLAGQWSRIAEEEPFVGRCGEVGDELGSALVAARLVRDLVRLCLLLHRHYPPYAKWLGSAFTRLPCAARLTPILAGALAATTWRARQDHLAEAYEAVAQRQNAVGLCPPLDPSTRPFHSRPFRVLGADRFARALVGAVTDARVAALPLVGGVDQYVDNTVLLTEVPRVRATAAAALGPVSWSPDASAASS